MGLCKYKIKHKDNTVYIKHKWKNDESPVNTDEETSIYPKKLYLEQLDFHLSLKRPQPVALDYISLDNYDLDE